MRQTCVTFETEDEPGQLGRICQTLSDVGVNIFACNTLRGNVVLWCDNVDACVQALNKQNIHCAKTEFLAVGLANTKGQLARLCNELGKADINIDSCFCVTTPTAKTGTVFIHVDNIKKAEPIVENFAVTRTVGGTN